MALFSMTRGFEVPDEFFAVAMRTGPRLVGSAVGAGAVLVGLWALIRGDETALEPVGAAAAAAGVLMLVVVARCGRFTVEVGRSWLRTGSGPFWHRVPVAMIRSVRRSPATGWRRVYSGVELVIDLGTSGGTRRIPVTDPEAVLGAVQQAMARVNPAEQR